MNIHLNLWLIYLINILTNFKGILLLIGILLIIWLLVVAGVYFSRATDISVLASENRETVNYEGRIGRCEDFCNELNNSLKSIQKIAIFLSSAIVIVSVIWSVIPSKEDAIQLVKINYINQSNILLDANSIETLSQNIDSVLKK